MENSNPNKCNQSQLHRLEMFFNSESMWFVHHFNSCLSSDFVVETVGPDYSWVRSLEKKMDGWRTGYEGINDTKSFSLFLPFFSFFFLLLQTLLFTPLSICSLTSAILHYDSCVFKGGRMSVIGRDVMEWGAPPWGWEAPSAREVRESLSHTDM